MTHSSDSLILSVVDYESRHRRNGRYPEALYYAGRVYYDLDDYPNALDFFQQAMEILPEDTDNQELRLRTLSQTGRLLATLRLYDKAIPYIKEVIEIEKKLKIPSTQYTTCNFLEVYICVRKITLMQKNISKRQSKQEKIYL